MKITVGQTVTINTNDTAMRTFNGKRAIVSRIITVPDDEHDQESLPMYVLSIEDAEGLSSEFWADEFEA